MAQTHHLACDLGAESGRLILGSLDPEQARLDLKEIHRFPTGAFAGADGALYWRIGNFLRETRRGLQKAGQMNLPLGSLSTDSWGVDYLLFDDHGNLMEPTFHYRDPRTRAGVERVLGKVERKAIFEATGIQYMPINTLFQLAAESSGRLAKARQLLLIADGFNYLMSGEARSEVSLASTSQLYDPRRQTWSGVMLDAAGVRPEILPPIVASGTVLGPLTDSWARETGLGRLEVIAGCSHDTGAAVAAIPAEGKDWAYISSGTWSLMGVELASPVISERCRELNFTNEIGYGNSVRLLKNLVGMWIIQECRREWQLAGVNYDYDTLTAMAERAPSLVSLVDPGDARFGAPDDMPEKIAAFCRETGQPVPESPGSVVRCVLESLALLYRHTLQEIQSLAATSIRRLHIVGGGSRNELLNRFAANACQVPVYAGPVEATAAGNVLVQALAQGIIPDLDRGRELIRRSSAVRVTEPKDVSEWNRAYARFEALCRPRNS